MERARRFRWDRLVLCVYTACILAFVAWVVLSYVNTVLHNTEVNPVYARWNLFTVLF